MPDNTKFAENGVKMLGGVADTMVAMMPAAGPVGVAIAAIFKGASVIIGIFGMLKDDTTVADALSFFLQADHACRRRS